MCRTQLHGSRNNKGGPSTRDSGIPRLHGRCGQQQRGGGDGQRGEEAASVVSAARAARTEGS